MKSLLQAFLVPQKFYWCDMDYSPSELLAIRDNQHKNDRAKTMFVAAMIVTIPTVLSLGFAALNENKIAGDHKITATAIGIKPHSPAFNSEANGKKPVAIEYLPAASVYPAPQQK